MLSLFLSALCLPLIIAYLMMKKDYPPLDILSGYLGSVVGVATVLLLLRQALHQWRQAPAGAFHPSLPLACAVAYLWYFIIGPIPSIEDPSFLRYVGGNRFYGPAYLFAGLAILAYVCGVVLVARRPKPAAPAAPSPGFVRDLEVIFVLLMLFIWTMRVYLGAQGRFAGHSGWKQDIGGAPMYLAYAHYSLRFALIPLAELLRSRARGRTRLLYGSLSVVELASYLLSGHRTIILAVAIQFALCRTLFSGYSYERTRRLLMTGLVLFFFVVNPIIVLTRVFTEGNLGTGQNQIVETLLGLGKAVETVDEGQETIAHTYERDFKYRINSLYFISAMMESMVVGLSEPGWGRYTARNAATVIPGFLWSGKREVAISNNKLEIAMDLKIPQVDYIQMLPSHWFADFGWLGLVFMLLTGLFDGWIWNQLSARFGALSIRLLYLTLFVGFLFPIEDFAGHFLMKWRETLPLFLVILALERRSLRGSARPGRLRTRAAYTPASPPQDLDQSAHL